MHMSYEHMSVYVNTANTHAHICHFNLIFSDEKYRFDYPVLDRQTADFHIT